MEEDGIVVKFVATKVIQQDLFLFTLTHFLDNSLRNKKKIMIVLVNENHNKWPNVSPVQHFCSCFDHANLIRFFCCGSNCYKKFDSVKCIFTNMST